jgi:uracil-DNA glycosylase
LNANENGDRADLDAAEAVAVLRWWKDAGVDLALEEAPQRRFDRESVTAREASEPRGADVETTRSAERLTSALVTGPVGDGNPLYAAAAASELAAASPDLEALRRALESFEGCALKKTATRLVFADGVPGSQIMLVGEAPGGEEDRIGRPFVGRAGQLLDRMLASIGLDRSQVYIANAIPWRPPGNRTPTPQETQACLPFIRRQIELSSPEILVCLGASAAQSLLGLKEGITRARGRWYSYKGDDGRVTRALAMLHPAYLLRQPAHKRHAWTDLRALAQALRAPGGDGL